jgi:hypothetical protein
VPSTCRLFQRRVPRFFVVPMKITPVIIIV